MRRAAGWTLTTLLTLGACAPGEVERVKPEIAASPLEAPHREGGRFFNPWRPFGKAPTEVLRFMLGRNPYNTSAPVRVPVVANDGAGFAAAAPRPTITWVGHATMAIHEGDRVVLTDPHFGPRALWPRRQSPPGVPIESVPEDAFALISHSHYDHLDAYSVDRLAESVRWFVPLGLGDWFRARGRQDVTELDWWQSATRDGWTITCLPSQHWSRRIGQATNATLWCSWLVDSGAHRYFFAGDTGYFDGFREFGRRFAPIDVALLPIGAYEPRWFMAYQHLDPREAYRAFEDLGARYMLPLHWGTFDLTYEPLDLAPRVLEEVVRERGADPARSPVLAVGEAWRLPERREAGPAE